MNKILRKIKPNLTFLLTVKISKAFQRLNKNKSFINKSIDVLVENKLDGQKRLFGRNQYMNSVIFDGNKNLIGKNLSLN